MAMRQSEMLRPQAFRRRRKRRRTLTFLVMAMALLIIGGAVGIAIALHHTVQQITVPVSADVIPEARPVPVQPGQRVNILVLGLDEDRLRSDTMLLVSVDQEARKVGVLQIPRDTRTLLAGKGAIGKINAAYAYGVGDKQFPANLRALKTVESLLSVPVHYTVVIDPAGFRKTIDAIGGVPVNITRKMDYDDPVQNLHIHFMPGPQKLLGKQALEFVRWRHNNDGTGYPDQDLGRIRAQQQFLNNLLDELLKPANLPRLPGQIATMSVYVQTTMEPSRLGAMAQLATKVNRQDIEFATLPGTDGFLPDQVTGQRVSYYLPDPEATHRLVDRLIGGIDPIEAAQVRVELVGGTQSLPVVSEMATRLSADGFLVTSVSSAQEPPATTHIVASRDDATSQLVGRALLLQGVTAEIIVQPSASADIQIVLGRDMTAR
ncbi:MAG: LCP family protein [Mycobacterium leprae]